MTGRDPSEDGRGASDLEVFYDLVFVVAFSIAGTQLAEHLAQGHYRTAIIGYAIATFAATWAWINFAWFASAFDTDDWAYRLLTLLQMVGVAIIAIGLPPVFASIEANEHVNLTSVVIGYIVMRVAMIVHWLRAAVQAPEYRRTCLTYAITTAIAQVGWVIVMVVPLMLVPTLIGIGVCMILELSGPVIAEMFVKRTPWHPEHIVERYATLVVITLGEGVVGTVAVLQTLIARTGWSVETGVLGLSAMGVTFAMWWFYFRLDVGRPLAKRPEKAFAFGYASMPIVVGCAASGAGLHLVAMWLDGQAAIPEIAVYGTVAIPIAVFCLGTLAMYCHLNGVTVVVVPLLITIALPLIVGGVLAALGVTLLVPITVVCLTPVLPVLVVEFAARSSVARLRR